jgi:hypothetical protein
MPRHKRKCACVSSYKESRTYNKKSKFEKEEEEDYEESEEEDYEESEEEDYEEIEEEEIKQEKCEILNLLNGYLENGKFKNKSILQLLDEKEDFDMIDVQANFESIERRKGKCQFCYLGRTLNNKLTLNGRIYNIGVDCSRRVEIIVECINLLKNSNVTLQDVTAYKEFFAQEIDEIEDFITDKYASSSDEYSSDEDEYTDDESEDELPEYESEYEDSEDETSDDESEGEDSEDEFEDEFEDEYEDE